jgi:hypothetical protein
VVATRSSSVLPNSSCWHRKPSGCDARTHTSRGRWHWIRLVTTILLGAAGLWPASAPAVDCYREIDPYYRTFDIPSMIHIATSGDAVRVRSAMKDLFWKEAEWPTGLPDDVHSVFEQGGFGYACTSPVDPRAIPGLALWLDSADTGTLTLDSTRVVAWRDKSGNGHDATQSVPSSQPLRLANPINGHPALLFDGTDDYLQVAPGLDLSRMTVFMVIRVLDADNVAYPAPLATNPVDGGYSFLIDANNKPEFRVRIDSDLYDARDANPVGIAPDVWAGSCDGTRVKLFRNGSEAGSIAAFGSLPVNKRLPWLHRRNHRL